MTEYERAYLIETYHDARRLIVELQRHLRPIVPPATLAAAAQAPGWFSRGRTSGRLGAILVSARERDLLRSERAEWAELVGDMERALRRILDFSCAVLNVAERGDARDMQLMTPPGRIMEKSLFSLAAGIEQARATAAPSTRPMQPQDRLPMPRETAS